MSWKNSSIIAADVHLAPYAWKSHPEISGDAYCSFKQIVQLCVKNKPAELLLAGDIIDRVDVDPLTMRVLHEQCTLMQEAGVPVRFIVGQHERHTLAQWLNVHDWPEYVHQKSWHSVTGNWYALDWQARDKTQESFAAIPPGTENLLTHHVWSEFGGEIMQPECRFSDVRHATTVFTGDYHVRQKKTGVNHHNHSLVGYSPGSTAMQSIDEAAEKCVLRVTRAADGSLAVDNVMLQTRRVLQYELVSDSDIAWMADDITAAIETDEEMAELPEEIRMPIVVVKYPIDWPKVYQRVVDAVGDRGHLFPKPQRIATEVVTIATNQVMALTGGLVNGIDLVAKPNEAHYLDLKSLLSLPNDPVQVRAAVNEILERVANPGTSKVTRTRVRRSS